MLRLVVDTDCGVDDALALILALTKLPDVSVEAITCVQGNTTLENVCDNVRRVVGVCCDDPQSIKVYKGCHRAIVEEPILANFTHGSDGFGDMAPNYKIAGQLQEEHAVNALTRIAKENSGELTLVTLGPLTNIAMAARMDKGFLGHWKRIYVMGGSTNGSGNEYLTGEFNIGSDPEAAQIVLHESPSPVRLVTIDVCRDLHVSWSFFDKWTSQGTERSKLIRDLYERRVLRLKSVRSEGFHAYDLLTMVVAFMDCPSLSIFKDYKKFPAEPVQSTLYAVAVELHGQHSRGGTFLERRRPELWHRNDPNCDVVTGMDIPLLEHIMMKMVS